MIIDLEVQDRVDFLRMYNDNFDYLQEEAHEMAYGVGAVVDNIQYEVEN